MECIFNITEMYFHYILQLTDILSVLFKIFRYVSKLPNVQNKNILMTNMDTLEELE